RHRVPSRGYRLDLPRAGRFDPAKARALNVPVPAWKLLQRGQSIPLENGAVVAPADVMGPARRGLRFVFSGDTAPCPALEQA
ncbi:MAG TPA: ribonuclease, partial [Faecalibacterium sp.]|nr:ribonuclease [Faecalibacterium sp.]